MAPNFQDIILPCPPALQKKELLPVERILYELVNALADKLTDAPITETIHTVIARFRSQKNTAPIYDSCIFHELIPLLFDDPKWVSASKFYVKLPPIVEGIFDDHLWLETNDPVTRVFVIKNFIEKRLDA